MKIYSMIAIIVLVSLIMTGCGKSKARTNMIDKQSKLVSKDEINVIDTDISLLSNPDFQQNMINLIEHFNNKTPYEFKLVIQFDDDSMFSDSIKYDGKNISYQTSENIGHQEGKANATIEKFSYQSIKEEKGIYIFEGKNDIRKIKIKND